MHLDLCLQRSLRRVAGIDRSGGAIEVQTCRLAGKLAVIVKGKEFVKENFFSVRLTLS